jgi:hypothetical protein
MADFIILDGDLANFMPSFPPATVVVRPGQMSGSGPATVNGKKICVDGDEKKLQVLGCTYMTPQFSIPGVGTLKINSLLPNQIALKTKTGSKKMILKGSQFIAVFEVQTPAQMPPPASTPDPVIKYLGQGSFITMNFKFKGQ